MLLFPCFSLGLAAYGLGPQWCSGIKRNTGKLTLFGTEVYEFWQKHSVVYLPLYSRPRTFYHHQKFFHLLPDSGNYGPPFITSSGFYKYLFLDDQLCKYCHPALSNTKVSVHSINAPKLLFIPLTQLPHSTLDKYRSNLFLLHMFVSRFVNKAVLRTFLLSRCPLCLLNYLSTELSVPLFKFS